MLKLINNKIPWIPPLFVYSPRSQSPDPSPDKLIARESYPSSQFLLSLFTWFRVKQWHLGVWTGLFLVSVPVFFEAPLVRQFPWLSLVLTILWISVSLFLTTHHLTRSWGDLMMGFSWSWLAGSIYWGWFRWEPLLHLPIEAIALPLAIGCILKNQYLLGSWFYLGSLLGTAVTDIYFYLVGLAPHWRKLMAHPEMTGSILHSAIADMMTPWGIGWVMILGITLLTLSLFTGRSQSIPQRIVSGTLMGTLLVDGLFGLTAILSK